MKESDVLLRLYIGEKTTSRRKFFRIFMIMPTLKLINSAIDVLFPAACPICNTHTVQHPAYICRTCHDMILLLKGPLNTRGILIPQIVSCRPYDNIIRKCIHQFKYNRKKHLIKVFEELIVEQYDKNLIFSENDIDIILPVPIYWLRKHRRGFNQSSVIAKTLSNILSIPWSARYLVKMKNTPTQTGLTRKSRIRNLQNSFSVSNPAFISGKSIMLTDDVITTGATLEICAKVLYAAGAKSIHGFTLAKAV